MTQFAVPMTDAAGEAPSAMAERERRQRVLKKAIASYANRSITIECLVRDLSPGGVKLKLEQDLTLPDHFYLSIPMDGIAAECEVRWRNGNMIGAQFISDIEIEGTKVRQRVDPTGAPLRRTGLRKF